MDSEDEDDEDEPSDTTPLIGGLRQSYSRTNSGFMGLRQRRPSDASSRSGGKRRSLFAPQSPLDVDPDYDVNNPPSVPGSPKLSDLTYDDVLLDTNRPPTSSDTRRMVGSISRDAVIEMDPNNMLDRFNISTTSPRRRMTTVEDDVCFPQEGLSEFGDEDLERIRSSGTTRPRRRRSRVWPDLSILEEWSREEKEERTMEGIRARKISEPLMIGGRLRPKQHVWHRVDEDLPYRFTYFNEEFQSTVHSQTISELLQDGQTFKDLFRPDPPELSDSSSDEDEDYHSKLHSPANGINVFRKSSPSKPASVVGSAQQAAISRQPSTTERKDFSLEMNPGAMTPGQIPPIATPKPPKLKKYGPRPTFWLDVLQPTDAEMKVISKAFGLHPLTAEDIMLQEAREKVELFGHYYFLNYRTFEQDSTSENYLEPVDYYAVVFREGVISFHFSMTPHPANVRRRIRQLTDYLILSSDWISYAIIDDITDVYGPLIERIEDEVDQIDDEILQLHASEEVAYKAKSKGQQFDKFSDAGEFASAEGDMLRRVGECRKKVMGLYRLLGNKADVIKGFAKRCNEHWEVAPRSEIGMYLGDIQDHIVTMTGNLTHYEK